MMLRIDKTKKTKSSVAVAAMIGAAYALAVLGGLEYSFASFLQHVFLGGEVHIAMTKFSSNQPVGTKIAYIRSVQDVVFLPYHQLGEAEDDYYIPTHIKLCYEWLRRDALGVDAKNVSKAHTSEHRDVCLDWSAPHWAMMEILSSVIIQSQIQRWRYIHRCSRYRRRGGVDGASIEFGSEAEVIGDREAYDWTPFQTVFSEAGMLPNPKLMHPRSFLEQCKACLQSYDPIRERERIRAKSFHHCFAFPEDSTLYAKDVSLSPVMTPIIVPLPNRPDDSIAASTENVENVGNVAPLSSVANIVQFRLYQAAVEWLPNMTVGNDVPSDENERGTVILIDLNSKGIDPLLYKQFIPLDTSSVTVLSTPLCFTSHLPTGQLCAEYAQRIVDALAPNYPAHVRSKGIIDSEGFSPPTFVRFQVPSSTATLLSQAILCQKLICPPDTIVCYLPAMGKIPPTKAIVMDGVCSPPCSQEGVNKGATIFFDKVGTNDGCIEVWQLPDADIPPVTEGIPRHPTHLSLPPTPTGFNLAPEFLQNQITGVRDGYPINGGTGPPPVLDPIYVSDLSSLDAYRSVEAKLPSFVGAASNEDRNEPSPIIFLPISNPN